MFAFKKVGWLLGAMLISGLAGGGGESRGEQSPPDGGVIGTWVAEASGRPVEMVIGPAGSFQFLGQPGTYVLQGEQIFVNIGGNTGLYGIRVSGDTLWLTGQDLGGTLQFTRKIAAAPPAEKPAPAAAPAPGSPISSARDIYFIRQEGNDRLVCSVNPAAARAVTGKNLKQLRIIQPALFPATDGLLLPISNDPDDSLGLGTGIGLKNDRIFRLPGVPKNSYVLHPSISRDGKLLAVRVESFQHYGTMDVHDASSGAYDHSFSAVGAEVTIASFDLASVRPQAVYFQNRLVGPGENKAWCPAFSPTQDILAFADNRKLNLHESLSGKKLREIALPESAPPLKTSGLAFSPDGKQVAFLSLTTYQKEGATKGIYAVVGIDVADGASKVYYLPETLRPYSAGLPVGAIICLDYSPDGKYIVLSGTPRTPGDWVGYDMLDTVMPDDKVRPCDLYVLDLASGSTSPITSGGSSFDPVWKGR